MNKDLCKSSVILKDTVSLIHDVLLNPSGLLTEKSQSELDKVNKRYAELSLSHDFITADKMAKTEFLTSALSPLVSALEDSDRLLGESIRSHEYDKNRLRALDSSIMDKKRKLGYDESVSFDDVFEDLIKKAGLS